MQAVISGRAGVALLLDGEELSSLHVGSGEVVRRREREVPYLLGDATDLQFVEEADVAEVERRLETAANQADALHLALILLDPELPREVRSEAALELKELLLAEDVAEHVESVLSSRPLPREADVPGALRLCSAQAGASADLLTRLQALQSELDWQAA
jgi:hypothetical protein